jgi:hypothetical protein
MSFLKSHRLRSRSLMTFIAPRRTISKHNQRKVSKKKLPAAVSPSTELVEGHQRYSHVGMPDKPTSSRSNEASNRRRRTLHNVTEIPKPSGSKRGDAGLTIHFQLEDRWGFIDLNVAELNQKPAEVIPIQQKRNRGSFWSR